MIAPENITLTNYSKIFRVSVLSKVDLSIARGVFNNSRRLEGKQYAEELQFEWEVVEHQGAEIQIQMYFENPQAVSNSGEGTDSLAFQIREPSVFKSALTFRMLEMIKSEQDFTRIDLPRITADIEMAGQITKFVENSDTVIKFVSTGNIFM